MAFEIITSSLLISNIHCDTCISRIKEKLSQLIPPPISVSASLMTQRVMVRHPRPLKLDCIRDAIESEGFGIYENDSESQKVNPRVGIMNSILTRSSEENFRHFRRFFRHKDICNVCWAKRPENRFNPNQSFENENMDKKQRHRLNQVSNERETLTHQPIVTRSSFEPTNDLWRADLAVGGMTCAACVATIKEMLCEKTWIKKVMVNLMMNSVSVEFLGENRNQEIVKAIKNIGYEAVIDNFTRLASLDNNTQSQQRTVEIIIDGPIGGDWSSHTINNLSLFEGVSKVTPSTREHMSSLIIIYTPQQPEFTIRTILATIAAVDPAIRPFIYHPPTLQEISIKIQARERLRILIRFLFSLIIAVPTLIIGVIYMSLVPKEDHSKILLMEQPRARISRAQWALFALATPVYLFCADIFHRRALKEIKVMWNPASTISISKRFYRFGSMNMLMSVGTSVAYISSLAQLIIAGVHPPKTNDNNLFYFDSVVFLTLFQLLGRLIEMYSKAKTRNSITMLGKLKPTEAHLVESISSIEFEKNRRQTLIRGEQDTANNIKTINIDVLEVGDVLRVFHGESPPCDGVIISGNTEFDESSLTGESRAVRKRIGDNVYIGTINKSAPIIMRVTNIAGTSMLDQILKVVREGQARQAPIERIADGLTSVFVPIITSIAVLTWLLWLGIVKFGLIPDSYFEFEKRGQVIWSLQFAIAVIVIACPCGLSLAAPTALFVGSGIAARHGILAKGGGDAFEKASKLKYIIFDKTGTLTVGGEPKVTNYDILINDRSKCMVFGMIKAIESNSNHTIAKSILSFCSNQKSEGVEVKNIEEIAGKGMKGTVQLFATSDELEIIIGNEAFLQDYQVEINATTRSKLEKWKSEGKSVAIAAIATLSLDAATNFQGSKRNPWLIAALFAISDPIRAEASHVIELLKKRGMGVWILSGDNQVTANAVGSQVGISSQNIIAGVLPEQKAERIHSLQQSLRAYGESQGYSRKQTLVAMVGDGINDSPALSRADVGIAIGSGSDIAISSAEFVLVSSNLNSIITLLDLSHFVFNRIKFNFVWALIYNLTALPVAAGVLFPIVRNGTHFRLDPVWASMAMAASSISVVFSSLSMRSHVPGVGFRALEKNSQIQECSDR